MQTSSSGTGWLYPEIPAIVWREPGGGVTLVDFARSVILNADGLFGAQLLASLDRQAVSPVLRALGGAHPAAAAVERLVAGPRRPLTAEAVLRLEEYGTLFLELTQRCTEKCLHCYQGEARAVSLKREVCEAVLEDAAALGFYRAQFTGGDALLCEFLPQLLERARQLGIEVLELFTNGLLLDDALLARLAPHRPAFAFSVYSHDPETHDRITQVRGSHRRTMAAIARVRAAGLPLRTAMVVMAENAGHVARTRQFLEERGVERMSVSGSYAVGRGDFYPVAPEDSAHAPPVALKGPFKRAGVICVAPDGGVYPCIFNRTQPLGNVPERRLREILQQPRPPRAGKRPDAQDGLRRLEKRLRCATCRCTAFGLELLGGAA